MTVLGLFWFAVYCSVKHYAQPYVAGRKALFGLHILLTVDLQGKPSQALKQGRNLQEGSIAETTKECSLLTCSSWLFQITFFIQLRTSWPSLTPPPMRNALPCQSLIKKIPHNQVYRPILRRHFLKQGTLFPGNF